MNKFIKLKYVGIIGILLFFLFLQFTVIKDQRLEIKNNSEVLSLTHHEHDYYNRIEINGDAIVTQDAKWIEMENLIALDFMETVENLKRDFENHGWLIKNFHRLENNTIVKSEAEDLVSIDSNNFIKHQSIFYEVQFEVTNGKLFFPQKIFSDGIANFEIKNLVLSVQGEEIRGVLSFIYRKQEINNKAILKI